MKHFFKNTAKCALIASLFFLANTKANAQCDINATSNRQLYEGAVSGYHGGIYAGYASGTYNQKVYIWGPNASPNGTSDKSWGELTSTPTGYNYTGTILKWGMASIETIGHQYTILTTTGLWAWGFRGTLYDFNLKSTENFGAITGIVGANTYDLPGTYTPNQVISFFTTFKTIAIVMEDGTGWVLSSNGLANTTNASSANSWKQVMKGAGTPLTGIKTIRGASGSNGQVTLIANCDDGVYVWGDQTFLGNGSLPTDRRYATQMTLPSGFGAAKMVQANYFSGGSYYILNAAGDLWAVGRGGEGQLGYGDSQIKYSWVRPRTYNQGTGLFSDLTNVNFISSCEHDASGKGVALNVLLKNRQIYAFGRNDEGSLGFPSGTNNVDRATKPYYSNGTQFNTERITMVETGGHTSMLQEEGKNMFCYTGHFASYSNGTTNGDGHYYGYRCTGNAEITFCPSCNVTVPSFTKNTLTSCLGFPITQAQLNANITAIPAGNTLQWFLDEAGNTPVTFPYTLNATTRFYARFFSTDLNCAGAMSQPLRIVGENCVDTDGDGIPDIYDLDSDNDGILDTDEGYCGEIQLLDTRSFSAKGAGTAGIPVISYSMPNGTSNRRFMAVYVSVERDHYPSYGSNWENLQFIQNPRRETMPEVYFGNQKLLSAFYWYNAQYNFTDHYSDTKWSSTTYVYLLTHEDIINGTHSFNLSNFSTPKNQGDEMKVTIAVYDNVFDFDGTSVIGSPTVPGSSALTSNPFTVSAGAYQPSGVSPEKNTLLYYAFSSAQQKITNTSTGGSWTILNESSLVNNAGTFSYTGQSEPDGIYTTLQSIKGITGNVTAAASLSGNPMVGHMFVMRLVPECTSRDTDEDGVPDYLDLDSDGDGCPDAIEGSDNVTMAMINANGAIIAKANGTSNGTVAEVDAQGVPKVVNTGGAANVDGQAQGQGIGSSQNDLVSACYLLLQNDINQIPQGKTAQGNVLTNDKNITAVTSIVVEGVTYPIPAGSPANVTIAGKGTLTFNANGTYTFVPETNYVGSLKVSYTGVNASAINGTAELEINVVPIAVSGNNPPVANNDTYSVEGALTATVRVLANDTDPDGDNLTVKEVKAITSSGGTTPAVISTNAASPSSIYVGTTLAGRAYLDANGNIVFLPETGFKGNVPFTYTVQDGNGGEDTAQATVTVLSLNSVNDVYANDDAYMAQAGQMITGNILTNDTFEGNGQLVVASASATLNGQTYTIPLGTTGTEIPNVGTVIIQADGKLKFVPVAGFVGTVPVVYTASNGTSTDVATAYITSVGTFYAIEDLMMIKAGETSEVTVISNDIRNGQIPALNNVTLTQVSTTNNGVTLNPATGKITVAANTPSGQYTVVYKSCDNSSNVCDETTVTVTVPVDSDGDGIIDIDDLDDDNDGILDTEECPAHQNLFVNGGLNDTDAQSNFAPGGWTIVPGGIPHNGSTPNSSGSYENNSSPDIINETGSGPMAGWGHIAKPAEGTTAVGCYHYYYSVIDPSLTGRSQEGIRQTVTNLKVGTQYTIYLKQAVVKSDEAQDGTGRWNIYGNNKLLGKTAVSSSTLAFNDVNVRWEGRTITFTADAASITFDFMATDDDLLPNVYMGLDDVKLYENTECDTDGDGIPNRLDVDSDDDGCPDAVEGSERVLLKHVHPLDLPASDPNYAYRGQIKVKADGATTGSPSEIISKTVNAYGVPELVNPASENTSGNVGIADDTDGTSDVGQGKGDSQNSAITNACKNLWFGNVTTTDPNAWNVDTNWTQDVVPTTLSSDADGIVQNVEFATYNNNPHPTVNGVPVTQPKTGEAVADLHVDTNRKIKNLINESKKNLIVPPGKHLSVLGKVTGSSNANLPQKIQIQTSATQPTGTFIVKAQPANELVYATVQFYNKAYDCKDCGFYTRSWQYFGIPVASSAFPYLTPQVETIHQWSEPTNGNKWIAAANPLTAFTGYEITNSSTTEPTHIYNFIGQLNLANATVSLIKSANVNYSGMNLISNSFTAAIPIATGITVPSTVEKTVYLFNTGTRDEWRKLNGSSVSGLAAGTYLSVPFNLAGTTENGIELPAIIPSMHAFMMRPLLSSANGNYTITLPYTQLTNNALVNGVTWRSTSGDVSASGSPLSRGEGAGERPYIAMDIIGSQSADRVWLFENPMTTRGFDNGWDGRKMLEDGIAQIYVSGNENEKFQVATVPQLDGTELGFAPDKSEAYTIGFAISPEVENRNLYLHDARARQFYPIRNGVEYTVQGNAGAASDKRFRVVSHATAEQLDASVEIHTQNNTIMIVNRTDEQCVAYIYDVMGKLVYQHPVKANITEYIHRSAQLSQGVYVVKVVGEKSVNVSGRVMLK